MKHRKRTSLIVQGLYCLLCIADVVLCLLYRGFWNTAFGGVCADIALSLTGLAVVVFVSSIGGV